MNKTIMSNKIKLGDLIHLQKQDVTVVSCKECGRLMVNVDKKDVAEGDLVTLRRIGISLSNPETPDEYCLTCDPAPKTPFHEKLAEWFAPVLATSNYSSDDEDDDDSGFFSKGSSGGGFGGFGGGSFGGGGASRSF